VCKSGSIIFGDHHEGKRKVFYKKIQLETSLKLGPSKRKIEPAKLEGKVSGA
jgi:hypothetical protein